MRLRVKFEKCGSIRYSSHKDLVRIFQRCFATAGVPVSYTQGFHPHMRMSFGPPLKTGWEGYDEYMDVQLENPDDAFTDRSNACFPDGLRVRGCAEVVGGVPKLAVDICAATYQIRVRGDESEDSGRYVGESLARTEECLFNKFAGSDDADGKLPEITGVTIQNAGDHICVEYTSTVLSGRVVAPRDVVAAAFGEPEAFRIPIRVARTAQFVVRNGEYVSPLSRGVVQGTL
jgi:radical SAM-linked protein